ncbi:hypothetical protein AB0J63_17550 [Streptosporangium canum]|uniref:hypothetical protein n=1 Tax=Streptosporangium canum TaxID=324952 RepID=UPI003413A97C
MSVLPSCPAWCADHRQAGHPDDSLCRTRSASDAYGETVMTYTPDEGAIVWLYNTRDELSVDEAEQLARALLTQVELARSAS